LPLDWEAKPWVEITIRGVPVEDPQFLMQELHEGRIGAVVQEQRIWKSQYFRFRGVNDFVLYNPSGPTFARGLRRVLACKRNSVADTGMRGTFRGASDLEFESALRNFQLDRENDYKSYAVAGSLAGPYLVNEHAHSRFFHTTERLLLADCAHLVVDTVAKRLHQMHCVERGLAGEVKQQLASLSHAALSAFDCVGVIWKSVYGNSWEDMTYKFQDEVHKHFIANVEHQKRALRQAIQKFRWNARLDPLDYHRSIKLCVKKEWAKPGKASRLFASYADGCLLGPEFPDFLKLGLFGFTKVTRFGILFEVLTLSVCTPETLGLAFEYLRLAPTSPMPTVVTVVYSDDAVVATNIGSTRWYNVDKVSKDSSAQEFEFFIMEELLKQLDLEAAKALVDQCRLPFEFMTTRGPCRIETPYPREGSGTVLTTVLNHVDNTIFGLSISAFKNELRRGDVMAAMKLAAFAHGHDISVEGCDVFEKVQFVKRSPVMLVDGSWSFMTNLGCRYRSLGTCDGDLTHITLGVTVQEWQGMTWKERGERLVGNVVQSWINEPANALDDAFRHRFKGSKNHQEAVGYEYEGGGSSLAADPASIERRYPGWLDRAADVSQRIVEVGLFDEIVDPLFATIMHVDYGLPLA